MKKYESMLTTIGKAKLVAAQAKGEHVQLTTFAVGSGIQATVETQKALQKEEWRGAITHIAVDSKDKNVLDVETVIPANEGGFHIREFGVFDEAGDLIIVGNTPESYKPLLDAGAASSMRIISKTIISNAANVTLLMDENALYVTHEYLTQQLNLHTGDNDNPHGVTKSQVGLGKVQDYELATEADAESGTSHQKYMTPLRTKQAITKQLDSHANDYVAHPGYANTTGTNAYSVTLDPKPTALVAGLGVVIKVGNNATANCTLNVNGLGAKPIVDSGGKQVKNLKADSIYSLRYGGTSFILQGEGSETTLEADNILIGEQVRLLYITGIINDSQNTNFNKKLTVNSKVSGGVRIQVSGRLSHSYYDGEFNLTKNGISILKGTVSQNQITYKVDATVTKEDVLELHVKNNNTGTSSETYITEFSIYSNFNVMPFTSVVS